MVSKGDLIELDVESSGYEGISLGRIDGLVVFVPYAVPGDRIQARVIRKKRKYSEAVIEEVLEASPWRVEPQCPYFGVCGGCTLQSSEYSAQLRFKREQVTDLMVRIGKVRDPQVRETLPAPDPYYYRNKMEFSFGANRWLTREEIESDEKLEKGFALGLHIPKRFDKILDLEDCYLQSPLTPKILNWVREHAREHDWRPYNTVKHTGWARNLVIRTAQQSAQVMVNLVVAADLPGLLEPFAARLRDSFPEVTSLVVSINSSRSPVAREKEWACWGDGTLCELLGGQRFIITPTSFFQPNTRQAERLFEVIRDFAEPRAEDTLYDLYCGVGAISLYLAGRAGRIVGVENHPESVELARRNANTNQVENCAFVCADAAEALNDDFLTAHGRPEVVVVDPPRAGLHPKLCKRLLELNPHRLVYSSCNPATQARDVELLSEAYAVEAVQPVDMFPQTYHIESVCLLQRRT